MGRHNKPAHNRKQGKKVRLPNGILSRSDEAKSVMKSLEAQKYDQEQKETMLPNLLARVRQHNLSPKNARDQRAGWYIGRLAMVGQEAGGLSYEQEQAATQWLEDRHAYMSTIAAPKSDAAFDPTRTPGRSNSENESYAIRCRNKYKLAREAVREAQNALGLRSNLWAALSLIVEQDKELPHMIGDLRELLNALAHHYGITRGKLKRAS